MANLGMPVSDTTILRSVKKSVTAETNRAVVRVVGVDAWAWRKGTSLGTVIVDLERRQVVELLADRSAATTADWLKGHPEIEVVSRDRAGLNADAAREGAPQARQIADRFHLLKNLRETIERQLGRFEAPIRESPLQVEDDPDMLEQIMIEPSDVCSEVATQDRLLRRDRDAARQVMFDQIRGLYDAGHAVTERCVASTCQSRVPWRRNLARRPTSGLSWHAVGPRGRPKSGICFLTSVIAATPPRTVTWLASWPRGASAHLLGMRVSRLPWTRKPQRRRRCGQWTR
jgi:hypothetical protein